ncbi:MAG: DNA primase small subunit domain-containing protein [Candidatus Methanomethylicaceae archaeon]
MHERVLRVFREYYRQLDARELMVKDLQRREIALLFFGHDSMVRHTSFPDIFTMKQYLENKAPAHLYYSSAYYRAPQAPDMGGKGWEGADLVFDVDADHIPTPCKVEHDAWRCVDCGEKGAGFPPESCPKCGMKRIESATWVCDKCLGVAKDEVFKLIDEYLIPDFGVSLKEVEVCFSGHRGYHLHIQTEDVRMLSTDGRREVADYVRGLGLDPRRHGFRVMRDGAITGPDLKDGGWRGRLARSLYTYLSRCTLDELKSVVVSEEAANIIMRNKERLLRGIMASPPSWMGLRGIELGRTIRIAKAAIREVLCNIDERVTIDVKRLIRYPNSLHGKSGLKATKLSYSDLESFDPLKDAVVFKSGGIKLYVRESPRVRIGDYEVGPMRDVVVEVPEGLGIYLLCKGAAELRE